MSKHTPGPWTVFDAAKEDGISDFYGIDAPNGDAVVLYDREGGIESEADARLIAAAPDLLEALQQLVACHDEPTCPGLDLARAAISKATGEQP